MKTLIFPKKLKPAPVTLLDKSLQSKQDVINYRSTSMLNVFLIFLEIAPFCFYLHIGMWQNTVCDMYFVVFPERFHLSNLDESFTEIWLNFLLFPNYSIISFSHLTGRDQKKQYLRNIFTYPLRNISRINSRANRMQKFYRRFNAFYRELNN